MDVCREVIARFRIDIAMYFGMDKCAFIHTAKVKMIRSLFIHDIPQLSGEDTYNYFGLL